MVISGFDFASWRIVGSEIASHAALTFSNELDGCYELRRFIAVAGRIDEPQGSTVTIGQGLSGHIESQQHARLQQLIDGEIFIPFVGTLETNRFGGAQGLHHLGEMAEAKAAPN